MRAPAGTKRLRSLAAEFSVSHETVRAVLRTDTAAHSDRGLSAAKLDATSA
jgi:hypothetical protein